MTPVSDLAAQLEMAKSNYQNVFNFILKFYEENKCGPTMGEVQEAMSLLYGEPWTKYRAWYALNWLSKRNLIYMISGGKHSRRMTRIVIQQAEWRFRGHRNVYLRSSITRKNVL